MLRRNSALVALVALAAGALAPAANAQQSYAAKATEIHAGIVVLDGDVDIVGGAPASAAPFAWLNLDASRSVKPAGWTFTNPHAATTLTKADRDRWVIVQSGISPLPPLGYRVPLVGTRLSKRTAPYWEVKLSSTTDAQLSDYDVLLVNPNYGGSLSPIEREKLRRFVDRGGILWVDLARAGLDIANGYPLPFQKTAANNTPEFTDFSQPLLRSPMSLSGRDLDVLQSTAGGAYDFDFIDPIANLTGSPQLYGDLFSAFNRIQPIVGQSSSRFSIGVGRIGQGFVVLTGRAISHKLNRSVPAEAPDNLSVGINRAFYARDPILQADGVAAAKMAVNIVSLAREFSQPQGGSQKSGSSPIDVGAPLLRRANDATVSGLTTAPVLYKGFLVVTAGNVVRVYDADPGRDADGDGKADDGVFDGDGLGGYNSGRDLIWQSRNQGGTLSSPICVEVPDTVNGLVRADGSHITDLLLVADNTGALRAFDLTPYISGVLDGANASRNRMPLITVTPPTEINGPSIVDSDPISPTVHEGIAYMASAYSTGGNPNGRIWMVDLRNLARVVSNGDAESTRGWAVGNGALPPITAAPTIGYIPILDNSGGMDKVLYAPIGSQGASRTSAGFISMWLGARGEKPIEFHPTGAETGTALTIDTRAKFRNLRICTPQSGTPDPKAVRITILDANGRPLTAAQMNNLFNGAPQQGSENGTIVIPFANGNNKLPDGATVRVDYTVDYGYLNPEFMKQGMRGDGVFLPDKDPAVRSIKGSIAMTPRGTIYMTVDGGNRAALFGFREEGIGQFRCVNRYELADQYTFSGNGTGDQLIPTAFETHDDLNTLIRGLAPILDTIFKARFTSYGFSAPPVVRNGVVYASASARRAIGVTSTLLLAFRAEPDTVSIPVGDYPPGSALIQPDLVRSTSLQRPELPGAFQANVVFDSESGTVRVENLSTSKNLQLSSVLNLSEPVIVRRPQRPDEIIYPDTIAGAKYSPLLWYSIVEGLTPATAGMAVTGDTLFLTGSSAARNVLTNGSINPEGMITAMSASIDGNDSYLVPTPGRTWLKQLYQLRFSQTQPANPAIKWPQLAGIRPGTDDYLIRLNQTVLTGSASVEGLAAGEGVVATSSTTGLTTFTRSDFLIADQNRVAAIDPGGNPSYIFSATSGSRDDGTNSGIQRKLVSPTRAYPLPNEEILIVDPGANRIFRTNKAGTEMRTLGGFRLDPLTTPANYPGNAPLTFNGPRDALVFTSYETAANVARSFTPQSAAAGGQPAYEYWVHYVVADTGNRRLLEIVDRYAYDAVNRRIGASIRVAQTLPNGTSELVPQQGVLLWHSPATSGTNGYPYSSISRVFIPGTNAATSRYVYFAGIGGQLPIRGAAAADSSGRLGGTGYGGLAVFDPLLPNGLVVANQMAIPTIPAGIFYDEASADFVSKERPATTRRFQNVESVTAQYQGASGVQIMVTDGGGVYEFAYADPALSETTPTRPNLNTEFTPTVTWMLPNEAFRVLRRSGIVPDGNNPRDLRATYARRVESGEVLIVNGYFGKRRNQSEYTGEVLQLSDAGFSFNNINLGFDSRSITFELPPIQGIRGLVLPVFADRR